MSVDILSQLGSLSTENEGTTDEERHQSILLAVETLRSNCYTLSSHFNYQE